MAMNIEDAYGNPASRVTIYGTLLTTAAERNPRVIGAVCADVIDSVFYNYSEGPMGNPQSLNLIGDTYQKGPAPGALSLTFSPLEWHYAHDLDLYVNLIAATTWTSGNRAVGFSFVAPVGDDKSVRRSSPRCEPSVRSIGASAAYAMVLHAAGPRIRSDQTARLLANVTNRQGHYYNGNAKPPPNPTWP